MPVAMALYQGKYRIESARLRGWDYRSRGWYFVTICTRNRANLFGEVVDQQVQLSRIGRIAASELQSLPNHYNNVTVDESVVMPNHVHAIIAIDGEHCFSPHAHMELPFADAVAFGPPRPGSLSAIIRSFKAGVTRRVNEFAMEPVIWQARFHDHLLRGDRAIEAVREYIRNNPVNWVVDRENPDQSQS
jgi:putative transposase